MKLTVSCVLTRPDSLIDFGAIQVLYLLTYLLTYLHGVDCKRPGCHFGRSADNGYTYLVSLREGFFPYVSCGPFADL